MIARGVYGKIYPTIDSSIVKKLISKDQDDSLAQNFLREASIYGLLKDSEYVPKIDKILIETIDTDIEDETYEFIFMEKFDGHVDIYTKYSEEDIRNIIYSVMCALYDMHTLDISHRDVKPHNVLKRGDIVKLCDFGISRICLDNGVTNISDEVQTLWYRAPEVLLLKKSYNCKIDMWSVGVMIYELCNGQHLMRSKNEEDHINNIFSIFAVPSTTEWPELPHEDLLKYSKIKRTDVVLNTTDADLVDLAGRLLVVNPKHRASVFDVINHNYFKKSPKFVQRERKCILKRYRDISLKFSAVGIGEHITFETRAKILTFYINEIRRVNSDCTIIFHSIHLIDKCISLYPKLDVSQYKLLCWVCYMLSTKIHCNRYVDVRTITSRMMFAVTCNDVIEMEIFVVRLLNCDLFIPDENTFLKIMKNTLAIDSTRFAIILNRLLMSLISDPEYGKRDILTNVVDELSKYYEGLSMKCLIDKI